MLQYQEFPKENFEIGWLAILIFVLTWALTTDLKHQKIPNFLTLGGFFVMLLYLVLTQDVEALKLHGLSALIGLILFVPLFALRAIGGGDVKLLVFVCLAFPIYSLFSVLCWIALTGGVQGIASFLVHKRKALPYAVAITGGVTLYLLTSYFL